MGGRYLISGTQVGLMLLSSDNQVKELARHIDDKQFVGSSKETMDFDVKKAQKMF